MKLTAQPPPPEPTNTSGSGEPSPNEPAILTTPHPEQPSSPTPPKAIVWPAWFIGADFLMVVLAVSLAFLVSSFVARNSDMWQHLAAGQRLLSGDYLPGTDPFSYSGAERAWVNHSLLFDVCAYVLYGGGGVLLVVLKALAVAATFGLVIAMRRPPFALWPWAVAAVVAILAAAPQMQLRPTVGSMLLLAVTVYLVFRVPHRANSWRFPALIALTFWVWAMTDAWFILGPIALALVLLGETIQSFWRSPTTASEGEAVPNPFGTPPPVRTLAIALGIGVLACMLTPHHVRIWELPFELAGSEAAAQDTRMKQQLLMSPLNELYQNNSQLGNNLNGLAYAVLFLGGGIVLGLGFGRNRITQVLLWVAFAALSLTTIYAIPFFAIVAAPIVAAQLNAFSARFEPRHWGDPKTRFLLLGSAGGRVCCLLLLAAACVLAWPGWMQPEAANPAYARRVSWGVEPDAGLVRVARQLESWRESGQLPADARGLIVSTELANYCAWFAPHEKVFLNGQFNHHRAELPEFVKLRSELLPSSQHFASAEKVGAMLDEFGASYLVVAGAQSDSPIQRNLLALVSMTFWADPDHWSPWYLDGRATVTGHRGASAAMPYDALKLDSVQLAFGHSVERIPALSTKPLPNAEGWESEFIHGMGMSPVRADEAFGWIGYRDSRQTQYTVLDQLCRRGRSLGAFPGGALHEMGALVFNNHPPAPEALQAAPFLSLRAALRGIAADPNHPDGYFALAQALREPELPLNQSQRMIGVTTAMRQCLMRMPPPDRYRPNIYRAKPAEIALELADMYGGFNRRRPGIPVELPSLAILELHPLNDGIQYVVQNSRGEVFPAPRNMQVPRDTRRIAGPFLRAVDLSREMMELASQYLERESTEESKSQRDKVDPYKKGIEQELVKLNAQFEREKLQGGQTKLLDQVRSALRNNLVGEALKLLTDKERILELGRESPQGVQIIAEMALLRAALELATGRLEDASTDLDSMTDLLSAPMSKEAHQSLIIQYNGLNYQRMFQEGNFKGAGELLEGGATTQIGKDPPLTKEEEAVKLAPFMALGSVECAMQIAQLAPMPALFIDPRNYLLLELIQPLRQRQDKLRAVRQNASNFFYQRGFLSLLEGDIAAAKTRFQQSRQPGVPDWGVPEVRHASAEKYLALIEAAEKTSTK